MSADERHSRRRGGLPRGLWQRVSSAPYRLLMLDYDGTLAAFHSNRDLAVAPASTLALVGFIAAQPLHDVAIVSGRSLGEMERLLGPLPVTLVAEHGWEMRFRDGTVRQHPLTPREIETIERAERAALDGGMGGLLERKRAGLVLHTRGVLGNGLARQLEEQAWRLWEGLAGGTSARLQRIDGGVELRLNERNKGTAVLALLSTSPPGTLAVFVGDDVTDEDAFEALRGRGFGVRVGTDDRPTAAAAHLPNCAAVTEFLAHWLHVVRAAHGPSRALERGRA